MDVKINRRLLPLKVAFFAMLSAATWMTPFLILFFKQKGLTPSECSIIFGSLTLANGVFRLAVGPTADKFRRHREMVLLFAVVSVILICCILLVPPVPKSVIENELVENFTRICDSDINKTIRCNIQVKDSHPMITFCKDTSSSNTIIMPKCYEFLEDGSKEINGNVSCYLFCNKTDFGEVIVRVGKPFGKTFWLYFVIYFVGYNLHYGIWPLLYGMTYATLGKERSRFGEQRLWATVGALTMSVATAFALNKYGSQQKSEINFTPCFVGFAVFGILTGISAMFIPLPTMPRNPTMIRDVFTLLKQPRIFAMFVVLFIMGFLWGAVETFLFWFLRSLGASSWTLGVCMFVGSIAEVPSLYLSGKIIRKIGYDKCLYIVLCVYCIRYLGTSLIPSPWWELPFTFLKSIVFSIGFTAVSVHSSAITPPSMHATLQAMVSSIHFGFGRGIGVLVFGPIMEAIGVRWAFRVCSALALVTCILFAIAQQFMPPVEKDLFDQNEQDVAQQMEDKSLNGVEYQPDGETNGK